jgi:hypothetical protein
MLAVAIIGCFALFVIAIAIREWRRREADGRTHVASTSSVAESFYYSDSGHSDTSHSSSNDVSDSAGDSSGGSGGDSGGDAAGGGDSGAGDGGGGSGD